jgi:hypothetical protein
VARSAQRVPRALSARRARRASVRTARSPRQAGRPWWCDPTDRGAGKTQRAPSTSLASRRRPYAQPVQPSPPPERMRPRAFATPATVRPALAPPCSALVRRPERPSPINHHHGKVAYWRCAGRSLVCPAGTYSLAGDTACTPCPTGAVSAAGASTCACIAGFLSSGSGILLQCTGMWPGAHCAHPRSLCGAGVLSACAPGTYALLGAASCLRTQPRKSTWLHTP